MKEQGRMTYEEAIQELEFILVGHPETSARGQAVIMAIEALHRSDCRKASWLNINGTYICSLCRHLGQKAHENDNPEWLWAYCPCCGAKMERRKMTEHERSK